MGHLLNGSMAASQLLGMQEKHLLQFNILRGFDGLRQIWFETLYNSSQQAVQKNCIATFCADMIDSRINSKNLGHSSIRGITRVSNIY